MNVKEDVIITININCNERDKLDSIEESIISSLEDIGYSVVYKTYGEISTIKFTHGGE